MRESYMSLAMISPMTDRELLTPDEAADYLQLSPRLLQQWRYVGRGPRFVKAGHAVRYRRADLDAWLDAHAVTPQGAA
jgi:excisionase family DNA binding protein